MVRKSIFSGLLILVLLLLSCKLSFKEGQLSLAFLQRVWKGDASALFIFYHMRLPAVLAILSTGALAVLSTFILQQLSKNELADAMALGYHNVALTSLALFYLYSPAMRQFSYVQLLFLSILLVFAYSILCMILLKEKAKS